MRIIEGFFGNKINSSNSPIVNNLYNEAIMDSYKEIQPVFVEWLRDKVYQKTDKLNVVYDSRNMNILVYVIHSCYMTPMDGNVLVAKFDVLNENEIDVMHVYATYNYFYYSYERVYNFAGILQWIASIPCKVKTVSLECGSSNPYMAKSGDHNRYYGLSDAWDNFDIAYKDTVAKYAGVKIISNMSTPFIYKGISIAGETLYDFFDLTIPHEVKFIERCKVYTNHILDDSFGDDPWEQDDAIQKAYDKYNK